MKKDDIKLLTERILKGGIIKKEEALMLINLNEDEMDMMEALFDGANKIRKEFMGNQVDLCTIMNVKSGRCTEDCKYCAQSICYETGIQEYNWLEYDKILERALEMQNSGAHRFSLVSSGKAISGKSFENLLTIYSRLKEDTDLELCASHGMITYEQALGLKEAGVSAYHHNIETSRNYYEQICSTHTYQDRIHTIENLQRAELDICCGGIIGMGESPKDRVEMAFELKRLNIISAPVNILNPVKGTPLEGLPILSPLEILKIISVYRFILPNASIRYAGGRKALGTMQNIGFRAGVNAALVGNYLTTIGNNIKEDIEMIQAEGLKI